MTWLKLDDRLVEHRKIRRLSDAAFRLHLTALCACAKDETDGFVTDEDISEMEHGPRLRKHVPALVDKGLWEPVPGGWLIHDFLDYNPSHSKQVAKREANRRRQEEWRAAKASQRDNNVTTALSQHPDPTRPDPTRPVLSVVTSADQSQVANARAALTAAQNAGPGEGWVGEVLGLEEAR